MCVEFREEEDPFRPGQRITVKIRHSKGGIEIVEAVWTGAARAELLSWWSKKPGHHLGEVSATAIAERADDTGQLVWRELPKGAHLFGIVLPETRGYRQVKIVTVDATPEDEDYFHHDRYVLLGPQDAPWANRECVDSGRPKRAPKYKPLPKDSGAKKRSDNNQPSLF